MARAATMMSCLALLLLTTGCNADLSLGGSADTTKGSKPEIPVGQSTDSLMVSDVEVGTGQAAKPGDRLVVHFVAGIYETGKEIESAWVSGQPLGFRLGGGEWNYGWEEGMSGMRVGGRRELLVPTKPGETPPGSELGDTVVYLADLVEIEPAEYG